VGRKNNKGDNEGNKVNRKVFFKKKNNENDRDKSNELGSVDFKTGISKKIASDGDKNKGKNI
jgi:hypothetical protein